MQKLKNYIKRVLDDCLHAETKSAPFITGVISAFILSLLTTPIIGIPLGMMILSHYVQKRKKSNENKI